MKEAISNRQAISMIILFITGSSLVLGSAKEAENDIWIAILLGLVATFLIVFMYGRILSRFPGKNLFDILISVFGKYIGRMICSIFIFYSFYLAALVLLDFSMFISIVGLEFTPEIIVSFCVIMLVIIGVKMGVEVLGRWSEFFARIIYPIILLIIPLMLIMVEVNNLKPVLANGLKPVLTGTLGVITLPFAEIIIFIMIFSSHSVIKPKSVYKVFFLGLLLGGFLIFATDVTAYLVLGAYGYTSSYFPVYSAVSRISIGNILQRVEIVIAVSFMIGGFIQICTCLLACCNGVARVMALDDYRFIVTPIGLLILLVSLTTYESLMENIASIETFRYFAVFIQIILPFLILIVLEIKTKISRKKQRMG